MREGMPLIFGWKVDFAKHPNGHINTTVPHLDFYENSIFSFELFNFSEFVIKSYNKMIKNKMIMVVQDVLL